MGNSRDLSELENFLEYNFKNKALLEEAMYHSSYSNERHINKIKCNERLEFLGDAVLELVSSDYIFARYPELPEGKLSKLRAALVCEPALFECSRPIELGSFIRLGKGEELGGGRNKPSVVSDAFEAMLGAVYLDGGFECARKIIDRLVLSDENIEKVKIQDSKSYLQEAIQAEGKNRSIEYKIIGESGPEHDKLFDVQVCIDGKPEGQGSGRNKKSAEKAAALDAVIKLGLMK